MYGTDTQQYAQGTSLTARGPWGINVAARALCPDGVVRAAKPAITADTFFSIPARVQAYGRTVSGFLRFRTPSGLTTTGEPETLCFVPTGRNAAVLTVGPPAPATN